MQIGNNTAAFNTWKNYTNNVGNLRKSMSKLSSGSRINNAGDDPSGLAMSERLRTQSRNTSAAAGNVENKLNYLQTADSWMQKIHDMLGRMGELAVMANDGTKSDTDKDVLQNEFKQMQDEITRITTGDDAAGKFNGNLLFNANDDADETMDQIGLQVGADGGQVFTSNGIDLTSDSDEKLDGTGFAVTGAVTANTSDLSATWGGLINSGITTSALGRVAIGSGAQDDAGAAVTSVNAGIDFISKKRSAVGSEMKRMEQTLDGLRSYEENISSTESRIRDVDVAKETSEMSKYSILQQVGTAMLAQANQMPQGVLQLVG